MSTTTIPAPPNIFVLINQTNNTRPSAATTQAPQRLALSVAATTSRTRALRRGTGPLFPRLRGGWSGDSITLPGMLDLETSLNGHQCHGLSTSAMVSWIRDFVNTYKNKTGRYPMIYTSPSWWQSCTGDSRVFASTCSLVMTRWAKSPGTAPGGLTHTIWQHTDEYEFGGNGDLFNGNEEGLRKLATG
ncbi:N,O-diacetylmuramidase [Blastomyces percursus]|uniref:N,O-diacetylmuramidase n=1 Tax=Blastomyces percursus TaxID=1658174 RepID=A0A1J9R5M9_9EURO|nr:N,O-diacetylmuramidase [Blastomyces percursus]